MQIEVDPFKVAVPGVCTKANTMAKSFVQDVDMLERHIDY